MRILYVAHRVPYPPNKGEKLRAYHHLRHLARRHDVELLAFVDRPEDRDAAGPLAAMCRRVQLVGLDRRAALARGALSLLRGRSLSEGFFASRTMAAAVRDAARRGPLDVAWAYSSTMARYLPAAGARITVADFVDVDSEKWHQYAADSRGPLRALLALEARRLRRYEATYGRRVDHVVFVSSAEAELFRTICPEARTVHVVANGVDADFFSPGAATAGEQTEDPVLLFTGALDYRPNVDAVRLVAREILPAVRRHVPAARFVAVGHRPPARLCREAAASCGAFSVAGSVPDVRPYFRAATVYVAPLRLGRGVQNKLLEAMAMMVPVVTSRLALAGLAAEPGRHLVVCDTPAEYAAAVVRLLRDPERRAALAAAAHDLVRTSYAWAPSLARLDALLAAA